MLRKYISSNYIKKCSYNSVRHISLNLLSDTIIINNNDKVKLMWYMSNQE